jgi:aminopeptidase 2
VLNEYRTATTSDERNTALRAIGRAKSPALIKRTLTLPLSDEVKSQDIYLPLGGLRTHKDGIEFLWAWMKENWDVLVKTLPPSGSMLSSVVSICTSSFTSKRQIDDIRGFFENRSTKGFDQALAQSLDAIKAKANWVERDGNDVKEWLKEKRYFNQ